MLGLLIGTSTSGYVHWAVVCSGTHSSLAVPPPPMASLFFIVRLARAGQPPHRSTRAGQLPTRSAIGSTFSISGAMMGQDVAGQTKSTIPQMRQARTTVVPRFQALPVAIVLMAT